MKPVTIPIVMAFDQNYRVGASVAIHSMLAHAARSREGVPLFYKIHCLVQGLNPDHIHKLQETAAPFADFSSLEFRSFDLEHSQKLSTLFKSLHPSTQRRFSHLILSRLVLPSLFPQYDKIVSCDVDVLFSNDMSKSYFLLDPDDPHYFAAAREFPTSLAKLIKRRKKEARHRDIPSKYFLSYQEYQIIYENSFNAGFLVLNLKAWRKDNLEDKCVEFFARKNYALLYPEQETLILMCHGAILELSYVYNVCPNDFNNPKHPIHQYIPDPKEIIMWHFYAESKPWYLKNSCTNKIWILALLHTPFAAEHFEGHYARLEAGGTSDYYDLIKSFLKRDILLPYLKYKITKKIQRLQRFLSQLIQEIKSRWSN